MINKFPEAAGLDAAYWDKKYLRQETGWDIGAVSPPLKAYFDQIANKALRILIPGGGNSYEAEYLWHQGFKNVFVVDIAPSPLANLKQRCPSFPESQLWEKDFFSLNLEKFDLIVEQTFFCAIHPSKRRLYAEKIHELLNNKGKLVGLLFNDSLNADRPPFGGNPGVYRKVFEDWFNFRYFTTCNNSIKPRQGRELFICFEKKDIHQKQ